MEAAARLCLIEIFKESALLKRREKRALEDDEFNLYAKKQQEDRDQEKREAESDLLAAIDKQLATFLDRLDHYDTAITHALMDNEHALDEVRKRREQFEGSAQRLPDGRLAFKANDGVRVFDQNGTVLSRETIDPDTIPDLKPKWETFKTVRDAEDKLLDERRALHTFQSKVDAAREGSRKDGVSKAELDAIGADLEKDMPTAVRQKLAVRGLAADTALTSTGASLVPDLREGAIKMPMRPDATFVLR